MRSARTASSAPAPVAHPAMHSTYVAVPMTPGGDHVAPKSRGCGCCSSRLCVWATWPCRDLHTFFAELSAEFGWRFVAIVALVYGFNQGFGEGYFGQGSRYYLKDVLCVADVARRVPRARRNRLERALRIDATSATAAARPDFLMGVISDCRRMPRACLLRVRAGRCSPRKRRRCWPRRTSRGT